MTKASNEPLISIIVPVYKVETYLDKCVNSIINQTYKNLEIILVDDGSPDNCPKMCDEWAKKDDRIKVIHKKNGGLSDARNIGIQHANGEFIGFVDSDDWIDMNMYKTLYSNLQKTNSDISICDITRVTGETIELKPQKEILSEYSQEDYLMRYFKIGFQTIEYYAVNKLYKRELLNNNQYPYGLTSEDVLGTYKAILKTSRIVKSNKVLYFYRCNENSITGSFSKRDFDLLKIWDMVVDYTKKEASQYLEYAKINRKRINYTLLMRMALNIKYSDIVNTYGEMYKQCLAEIKKDKKTLLKNKMPISRKVCLILMLINYKLFCNIVYSFNKKRR